MIPIVMIQNVRERFTRVNLENVKFLALVLSVTWINLNVWSIRLNMNHCLMRKSMLSQLKVLKSSVWMRVFSRKGIYQSFLGFLSGVNNVREICFYITVITLNTMKTADFVNRLGTSIKLRLKSR